MHRNYKSGIHNNNTIAYNNLANKIIKDNTVIDGVKLSKKISYRNYYKPSEKKYKSYDYYDEYDCDISEDEDYY